MDLTITIAGNAQQIALDRARIAHNGSSISGGAELDAAAFLQRIVDQKLAEFAERFLVKNVTRLAFLNRFTADERIGIRTAAAQSPAVHDYMAMLDAAQDVDLTDPRTIGGVQALEGAGLIGEGRAAEILAL